MYWVIMMYVLYVIRPSEVSAFLLYLTLDIHIMELLMDNINTTDMKRMVLAMILMAAAA